MCPICLTTVALATAGVTSAGGLTALLVRKLRTDHSTELRKSKELPMDYPTVVSRDVWLAARRQLLEREKDLTRQRDALNAQRRRLPMVKIDKGYRFDSATGTVGLIDLFDGRRQLIVYHFMFDPQWEEGCPSCSLLVDNIGHL